MRPSRRTVLKVAGGVGLGGAGIAYWNRRWLRRRDDVDAIETTLKVTVPTVANPVTVTDAHLDAAYSWAREHVETTERKLPEMEAEAEHLENANEDLAGNAPDEIEASADRHEALTAYRLAVASSAMARGNHLEPAEGLGSDELRDAHKTLGEELDAFDTSYVGESLTRTVVQASHAESLTHSAESRYTNAPEYMAGDRSNSAMAWERVATGRVALHDAEWFQEVLATDDTVDRTEALEACNDRLAERIESATDGVQWEDEHGMNTWASGRWRAAQMDHRYEPDDAKSDGRLALAVSIQAEWATVAETLAEFDDVPGWGELGDADIGLLDDVGELVAEKRSASDRLSTTADAVGTDPLGAHLLRRTIQNVELADSSLDHLQENVRSYETAEWQTELDRAALRYRSAAADADAIPTIVSLVADGS
ncbi:hypothetical protein C479_07338 [Halovivax asiaticus JCM 14624]|uniref:Uncharacterized protein n=1 Tax=Halovivax asiaticus JCM 14624 TaxID=1227490 RepID=M0BLC9_9EURY|nr:hypothetical protein [Halovivax asiaticus]ELZ11103.1 hypothetical protein C479_07338 [Halovivax asiaticus JCM 14624]